MVSWVCPVPTLPGPLTHLTFASDPGRCPRCVCSADRPRGPLCKSLYLRTERSSARCRRGQVCPVLHRPLLGGRDPTSCAFCSSPSLSRADDLELRLPFFTSFCSEVPRAYSVLCPRDPCHVVMLYSSETGLLDPRPCPSVRPTASPYARRGGTEADRATSVPKRSPSDSETAPGEQPGPPGPCGVCTPLPVSQLSGYLGVPGWGASSPLQCAL